MITPKNTFPFRRHILTLAIALSIGTAHAAKMNVDGVTCILANAINNANTDTDTDGPGSCPAGNGADILNLKANKIYLLKTVDHQDTTGPSGLPVITSTITVNGNGATIKRSAAVGTPDFRLLRIVNGRLTLNNLSLSGGKLTEDSNNDAMGWGGGVFNSGTLTLNNSTVSGNSALGKGGLGSGIVNDYAAILTLNNSTVSGNTGDTAAALANIRGTVTLNNSTVSNNRALNGGVAGIVNIDSSTMTLVNSTVSGNRSLNLKDQPQYGTGGIQNSGTMTLVHSTVSNNRIAHGNRAGISNHATLTLVNSLIANSIGGADCYSYVYAGSPDKSAKTTLQGTNLIEDGTCGAPLSGDPKLAPLLDNGGATFTHALRKVSPAINVANTRCRLIDQRHVSRPQPTGGICDIGAFERVNSIPANMKTIISFFDTQVANGGIAGIGNNAAQKPGAIRNQLLAAGTFKTTQACGQLSKTLTRLDADNTPDSNDYATGSQIAGLISRINALRTSWQCP